jgi:hypothetical protein
MFMEMTATPHLSAHFWSQSEAEVGQEAPHFQLQVTQEAQVEAPVLEEEVLEPQAREIMAALQAVDVSVAVAERELWEQTAGEQAAQEERVSQAPSRAHQSLMPKEAPVRQVADTERMDSVTVVTVVTEQTSQEATVV